MPANTNRRFLDRDDLTGATEYFHSNADGTEFVVERVEDVEPIIELNKAFQNEKHDRHSDVRLVASFPMSIWWDLKQRGILDDQNAYAKWLNSSDNRVFRIGAGRV